MIKKKREAQMINIRNKTENDTTDPTDIKMIIEENKRILCLQVKKQHSANTHSVNELTVPMSHQTQKLR